MFEVKKEDVVPGMKCWSVGREKEVVPRLPRDERVDALSLNLVVELYRPARPGALWVECRPQATGERPIGGTTR